MDIVNSIHSTVLMQPTNIEVITITITHCSLAMANIASWAHILI